MQLSFMKDVKVQMLKNTLMALANFNELARNALPKESSG